MIDAIERNRLYFDYRFYRQHTFVENGEFIKDITKIGRDISKTIIVDNMPQNFRLQKENGIFIKTFYGHDTEDTALFDLATILVSNYLVKQILLRARQKM
jgi:CTD small phosphatase-like protein 2